MLVRMLRKGNSCALLLVGFYICTVTVKNNMEFSEKINSRLPYDITIPLLRIYPKETKTLT